MKNIILLISAAALCMATSCGSSSSQHDGLMYVPVTYDGRIAYMNPEGEFFLENEKINDYVQIDGSSYRFISYRASLGPIATLNCFSGGEKYFVNVESDDLMFALPSSSEAGFFNNGVVPVVKDSGPIKIYDVAGRCVFTLYEVEGRLVAECDRYFNDGLLRFRTFDGHYGFVDTEGRCVIKPEFTKATIFYKGHALLQKDKAQAIYGTDGQKKADIPDWLMCLPDYQKYSPHGYQAWDKNSSLYLVAFDGTATRLTTEACIPQYFTEDYVIVADDNFRYAVKDYSGNTLIDFSKDAILAAVDNATILKFDNTTGRNSLIDPTGAVKCSLDEWDRVEILGPVHGYTSNFGIIGVRRSEKYYLDKNGRQVHQHPVAIDDIGDVEKPQPLKSDTVVADLVFETIMSKMNAEGIGEYRAGGKVARPEKYYTTVDNPLGLPYRNELKYTYDSYDQCIQDLSLDVFLNEKTLRHSSELTDRLNQALIDHGWMGFHDTCITQVKSTSDVLTIEWRYIPEYMRKSYIPYSATH